MLARVLSYGLSGLDAFPVTIEVDVSHGLPSLNIVGLPDSAVKESKERVRAAIINSGFQFKPHRVTVNLSPADIKKEGPGYDLAIALGFLAATNQIDGSCISDFIIMGELSLNGELRPVSGCLSISMSSPNGVTGLILPAENAAEAALAGRIAVFPAKSLSEVVHFLKNMEGIPPFKTNFRALFEKTKNYNEDFSDVKGQALVKRGLEVAAAGGHNCLMIGPPGSGKTMLAKRIPSILPDMTIEESLETTRIHSAVGLVAPKLGLVATRPFRSPHHTSSDVALVGGGNIPKPGEISLSHNGVLFLDELPEFHRNVLESLRQPLEDHYVMVSRAAKAVCFPARFMLVASMNPCPCGYSTDARRPCHCSPVQIQRYIAKISGPLLDRIDIHLEVPALRAREIFADSHQETSQEIKKRTSGAREIQLLRFRDFAQASRGVYTNAQMNSAQIKKFCCLSKEGVELLKTAIEELGLSARAHDKILKVSRTISDLEGSETIQPDHLAEAIQYRSLDREFFG